MALLISIAIGVFAWIGLASLTNNTGASFCLGIAIGLFSCLLADNLESWIDIQALVADEISDKLKELTEELKRIELRRIRRKIRER